MDSTVVCCKSEREMTCSKQGVGVVYASDFLMRLEWGGWQGFGEGLPRCCRDLETDGVRHWELTSSRREGDFFLKSKVNLP